MTTLFRIAESLVVFAAGMLVRLLLFAAIVAVIALPIVLVLFLVERFRAARRQALGMTEVAGMGWRSGLLHTTSHLWLKRQRGETFRLGLDGLAQRILPHVQRVILPKPARHVRRGEPLAQVFLEGREMVIGAPFDGRVTRVNRSLARKPELLEHDPYLGGWMVELQPEQIEYGRFLRGEIARQWFKDEGGRLRTFFERELGLQAADGGEPIVPPASALSDEKWRQLADSFLRA